MSILGSIYSKGDSNEDSYGKTAILFSTTNEEARIGFERKNP